MKCKYCGQEIKEQTNFDKLKSCQSENDIDEFVEEFCKKKICPYIKICPVRLEDGECLMGILTEWLFKKARNNES